MTFKYNPPNSNFTTPITDSSAAASTFTGDVYSGGTLHGLALAVNAIYDSVGDVASKMSLTAVGTGLNGNAAVAKAGAIATPNAQTAAYVQADVTSLKTAIDAIRVALTAIGITA